jgi:hypothetical protein
LYILFPYRGSNHIYLLTAAVTIWAVFVTVDVIGDGGGDNFGRFCYRGRHGAAKKARQTGREGYRVTPCLKMAISR